MARLPSRHQTLLFSATMPKEIEDLANGYLNNPVTVKVNLARYKLVAKSHLSHHGMMSEGRIPVAVARSEPSARPQRTCPSP